YGFAQGALAAVGLAGGILSGIFADRLHVRTSAHILAACALCIFPIGITLLLSDSGILNYLVLTICCFFIMVCSTIFMVQMMTFIQTETPPHLTGKVISLILTVSMCSQPLGNAMYGVLFEAGRGYEYAIVLFSGTVSLMIAVRAQKIFRFT
ncbi:MAG: MFS transporter, partial [Lachnospiraceae bacterium]|nr:MFS transporter [Lachnospiraceae bacterium]